MKPSDTLPANAKPAKIRLSGKLDESACEHLVGPGIYAANDGAFDDECWELVIAGAGPGCWLGLDEGFGIDAFVLSEEGGLYLCAVVHETSYTKLVPDPARGRDMCRHETHPLEYLVTFLIESRFVEPA